MSTAHGRNVAPLPAVLGSLLRGEFSRRRFLATAGLAAAAWSLGGCRSDEAAGPLTLWSIWPRDPGMPISGLWERLARALPSIPVEAGTVSTAELKEKLLGAAQERSLPDLFLLNSAWLRELGGAENLADLGGLARADGLDPAALLVEHDHQRCRLGERLLCLPATSARATSLLFTNKGLLARFGLAAPGRFANWAEFTAASREWVARANPAGTLEYIALDPFMGPGMVIHTSLALGIGAPTVSADGRHSQLASPGSLRVARELDRFVETVYGPFGGYRALLQFRFRFTGQHRQPAFYALPFGRSFANISAAGTLGVYQQLGVPPAELALQPVPGLDRLHGGILSHGWSYAISRHCARTGDAWRVLRFLTLEPEGAGRFCIDYRRPAHLRAIGDADYYKIAGEAWNGVREAMALDIPYPASSEDEFLRFHLFTVPMRRLQGESIEAIFQDLHAKYQSYLDAGSRAFL